MCCDDLLGAEAMTGALEKAARAAQDAMTKGSGGEPYRAVARAVLLAVRKSGGAVREAGRLSIWNDEGDRDVHEMAEDCFTAMIDAILTDTRP